MHSKEQREREVRKEDRVGRGRGGGEAKGSEQRRPGRGWRRGEVEMPKRGED